MNEPREYLLLDSAAEPWTSFAASQSQANIFHHTAWANLMSECYGFRPFVVAVGDSNDIVCAGLPMMETGGRLAGRRWVSLPFTDHCSPLHDSPAALDQLTSSLIDLSLDRNVPEMELRCELPPRPAIRSYSHYVLHTVPLGSESEAVRKLFASTHRRNIKVAENRGVRIKSGTRQADLDAFYRLHLETRRRQGVPIQPRRFFDLLRSNLLERGLGFVMLAHKDDEVLAAAVFLHWGRTLTYKFGASSAAGLSLRPNNLLFWTAIRWGCDHGYSLLDMGRTDLANVGLREFKKGWGAQEVPLVYSDMSTRAPRSTTDKVRPLMQAVIRSSPPWVCRATGEMLYKHFG